MGQVQEKIVIREADLGPVIARADHQDGAIEVNSSIFYKLPPMAQEFVLCHEVCHLRYNEYDEARTNQLAADLFVGRAHGEADRNERKRFVSYLYADGYDNFAWSALIGAVVSLGINVYGIIASNNAGWYSLQRNEQQVLVTQALAASFEAARKSGSKSAAQFFWEIMKNYTNKDDSLDQFLERSNNAWVKSYISKAVNHYGFGFYEVTPIDITAFPLVMVAIGIVVGYIVYKIIKRRKK